MMEEEEGTAVRSMSSFVPGCGNGIVPREFPHSFSISSRFTFIQGVCALPTAVDILMLSPLQIPAVTQVCVFLSPRN